MHLILFKSALQIADVAVIGVPDARHGELPRAYIVKASPGTFSSHVFMNHESTKIFNQIFLQKLLKYRHFLTTLVCQIDVHARLLILRKNPPPACLFGSH